MGKTEAGDEPEGVMEAVPKAPTKRLAFDSEEFLKDVPQFLKQGIVAKPSPEEYDNQEDLEPEPIDPIFNNSTENEKMDNLEFGTPQANTGINPAASEAALQSLAEMTIEQLKTQQAEIDRKIQEKQHDEKQAVITQIVQVVHDYNIPIEELVEALGGIKLRRKGTKAKPKYRDPATGTTWSGRGKEPSWIGEWPTARLSKSRGSEQTPTLSHEFWETRASHSGIMRA